MILTATCPVRLPGGAVLHVYLSRLDWRTWVGWIDSGVIRLPNGRMLRRLEPLTAPTLEGLLRTACARGVGARATSRTG